MPPYRTPALLRYSCSLLVYVGCIALAPYFVHASKCEEAWPEGRVCVAPYVMAGIYTLITMLLLNIQVSCRRVGGFTPVVEPHEPTPVGASTIVALEILKLALKDTVASGVYVMCIHLGWLANDA
jgi:hypothetical protein